MNDDVEPLSFDEIRSVVGGRSFPNSSNGFMFQPYGRNGLAERSEVPAGRNEHETTSFGGALAAGVNATAIGAAVPGVIPTAAIG